MENKIRLEIEVNSDGWNCNNIQSALNFYYPKENFTVHLLPEPMGEEEIEKIIQTMIDRHFLRSNRQPNWVEFRADPISFIQDLVEALSGKLPQPNAEENLCDTCLATCKPVDKHIVKKCCAYAPQAKKVELPDIDYNKWTSNSTYQIDLVEKIIAWAKEHDKREREA